MMRPDDDPTRWEPRVLDGPDPTDADAEWDWDQRPKNRDREDGA